MKEKLQINYCDNATTWHTVSLYRHLSTLHYEKVNKQVSTFCRPSLSSEAQTQTGSQQSLHLLNCAASNLLETETENDIDFCRTYTPTESRTLSLPIMHVPVDTLPGMPGTNDYADSKTVSTTLTI